MRLKEITIKGFRGFNLCQPVLLDNNVVLIYGLNGSGKSSVVEAIEWLFFNEISRKTRSSCPSEYRTEYLKNLHYTDSENPFVEAKIILKGEELAIKKELISTLHSQLYINGDKVADLSTLGISFESYNKPILSQGEIKRFVDTEQKDRWTEISKILGLDIFDQFRTDIMSMKVRKEKEELYISSTRSRDAFLEEAKQFPELGSIMQITVSVPYEHKKLIAEIIQFVQKTEKISASDIDDLIPKLTKKSNEILQTVSPVKSIQKVEIPTSLIDFNYIDVLRKQINNIAEGFTLSDIGHFNRDEINFFQLGLKLIKGKNCPFCDIETITEKRIKEITEYITKNQEKLTEFEKLNAAINELNIAKENLIKETKVIEKIKEHLTLALQDIEGIKEYSMEVNQIRKFVEEILPNFDENIFKIKLELDGFYEKCGKFINLKDPFNEREVRLAITNIEKELNSLKGKFASEFSNLQKVKDEILSKTPGLSSEDRKKFDRIAFLQRLSKNINQIGFTGIYTTKLEDWETLRINLESFEREKVGKLLKSLSLDIQKYYNRLNPNEKIMFSEIVPSTGKTRQAKIKAVAYGKDMNPVTCFSEAHMNSLGLSLYFPQRVDHNPDWEFVILDDPVQSMDVSHSANLIDIFKDISKRKQVIVLTHQKYFCEDFDDIFYDDAYLKYEFFGEDEKGPRIEKLKGSLNNCLDVAKKNANGNTKQRENAATELRKGIEVLATDILIQKYGQTSSSLRKQNLDDLLRRLEGRGIDKKDLADIRTVINIGDPSSHGNATRDIAPSEIHRGIEIIERIKTGYL